MRPSSATPSAICAHLRAREEALLDPIVRRDPAQVSALLSEDFLEFGSSGRAWSRQQILDLLAAETYQPALMRDFECHSITQGVILATYRTVHTDPETGARTEALRSSIWVQEFGVWRVRFHQGTRVPQA
jgi:hypothetical protein